MRRPPHVVNEARDSLPTRILGRYKEITLCIDIMHVNGIPMLVSISRNIRFGTIEPISNRKQETLLRAIKSILAIYKQSGFRVTRALMDNEFEVLRNDLADMGILLNEAGRDEHVGDIERYIRTIKERMRATYNTLPFKSMPHRITMEMAKHSVYWLNAFPHPLGVSSTMSPRSIVTGQNVDFNRHCKYGFGQYVQTHEQHDNTMIPRTIGALVMRPTGNAQGNYYYFSLSSGRIINRTHATPLPMPDDVIERVHTLARRQNANQGLLLGTEINNQTME